MVNSLIPAFFIPNDKLEMFLHFLRSVFDNRWVSLSTLQRLGEKIISFSLSISACKSYTREIFSVIGYLSKNNKQVILLSKRLQEELHYCLSLETWQYCLPWQLERHSLITLHTDASKKGSVLSSYKKVKKWFSMIIGGTRAAYQRPRNSRLGTSSYLCTAS